LTPTRRWDGRERVTARSDERRLLIRRQSRFGTSHNERRNPHGVAGLPTRRRAVDHRGGRADGSDAARGVSVGQGSHSQRLAPRLAPLESSPRAVPSPRAAEQDFREWS
jgi:hypothetical protein